METVPVEQGTFVGNMPYFNRAKKTYFRSVIITGGFMEWAGSCSLACLIFSSSSLSLSERISSVSYITLILAAAR